MKRLVHYEEGPPLAVVETAGGDGVMCLVNTVSNPGMKADAYPLVMTKAEALAFSEALREVAA